MVEGTPRIPARAAGNPGGPDRARGEERNRADEPSALVDPDLSEGLSPGHGQRYHVRKDDSPDDGKPGAERGGQRARGDELQRAAAVRQPGLGVSAPLDHRPSADVLR